MYPQMGLQAVLKLKQFDGVKNDLEEKIKVY